MINNYCYKYSLYKSVYFHFFKVRKPDYHKASANIAIKRAGHEQLLKTKKYKYGKYIMAVKIWLGCDA